MAPTEKTNQALEDLKTCPAALRCAKVVPVVIAETEHRRYDVFQVEGLLGPVED